MIRTPTTTPDQRKLQRGENQRIYTMMRRFFAPVSLIPPPGANPNLTGGRQVVCTTQTTSSMTNNDTNMLKLVNGSLTWNYSMKFKVPPNVTATPVGESTGSYGTLHLKGPGSNVAVIVESIDTSGNVVTSDDRLVQLHAIGPPD